MRLARALFDVPVAQIASPGASASSLDRACDLTFQRNEVVWIPDLRDLCGEADPARLFVGAPVRMANGHVPAVIFVSGPDERPYDEILAESLRDLAEFAADAWSQRGALGQAAPARQDEAIGRIVQDIVGAAPLSLVFADRDLRLLAASPKWKAARGLKNTEDVKGRLLSELAPDLGGMFAEDFARCLAGELVRRDRVEMRTPDGGQAWQQIEMNPWRAGAGDVSGLMMCAYDVTELVEALARSERAQERLTLALDIADVHVWEMDYIQKTLVKAGPELAFYSEPKTYEELAPDLLVTVDPRDRDYVSAVVARFRETGEKANPEYRIARSDGKEVWTSCTSRTTFDGDGKIVHWVGAMQNITARKQQERALQQAKEAAEAATRAKSAFLATMSHEIRTPLNGVLGMAQAMASEPLSPAQRKRLDVIRHSGESLLTILNDVLDLSKIEAGKLEIEETEFDVGEVVRSATAMFAEEAWRKGLTFDVAIGRGAGGVCLGDPGRVRQVVHNLVSNALKFTDRGGVKIDLSRRGDELTIIVEDSGVGMSPDQLARVFQTYQQADISTTRRYGGTGLGLAICRELVERMGGAIRAESEPGVGSLFVVNLPLRRLRSATRRPRAATVLTPPPAAVVGLRVLAAEDNGMNQLVLKTLLSQVGIEPTIVDDGREAVAAWEREPWDLILMDVQMPVMDGPTAAALIRTQERATGRPRTPIIALTANAMSHQVAEYAESGMDGFVAKPIDMRRLIAAMQDAVEGDATSTAVATTG